jgi:hypothetical protein
MPSQQIYTSHVPQGNRSAVAWIGIAHASWLIACAFVLSGSIGLL